MRPLVTALAPPEVPLDADVRWVLLAAFADSLPEHELPSSPTRAAELIRQMGLVQQVASRRSLQEIASDLGNASAHALTRAASQSTMRSLAVTQARNAVLKSALRAQVQVALLKGVALELLNVIKPGERYHSDVDVLVALPDREKLLTYLLGDGFTVEHRKEHVNAVVVVRSANTDIGVELHTNIHGVRVAAVLSPDMSALREAGLLVPAGEPTLAQLGEGCVATCPTACLLLPTMAMLGAQLVIQGWYLYHFVPNAPRHKTPMRLLVDLCLLRVHEDAKLAREIYGYVQHMVPQDEYFGLIALAGALTHGNSQQLAPNAQRALHHIVAASIDEDYRRSLMLERQRYALRGEGLVGWTRRQLMRLFLPSRAEIRALMTQGKARSPLEARVRIAWRLAVRGARGGWASLLRRRA